MGLSDDSPGRADAFGLVGMEERARLAGAELLLQRPEGGGTQVVVRLPLGEPATAVAASA